MFDRSSRAALLCAAATLSFAATPAFADTDEDWGSFGIQTQYIDESIDPGDDFEAYVNAGWDAANELPADKNRYGSFDVLSDLSDDRLKLMLEEIAAGTHAPGSAEAQIAAAWKAFMDTDAIEAAGLAPAQPYLDRIMAAETKADLVRLFASPGYSSPITAYSGADPKNSEIYALTVGQGGLGMPDRDYYLVDNERNETLRTEYKKMLTTMLGEAGYADPAAAAESVYALERQMATEMWDRTLRRNRDLTYTRIEKDNLAPLGNAPLVETFLDSLGADDASYLVVSHMPPDAERLEAAGLDAAEVASQMGGGMPATLALIETTPLATWKAYLAAHFLADHGAYLPKRIDDAQFAFNSTALRGQPEQRPRWKRAISAVQSQYGDQLGRLYGERYYPPEERAAMEELVGNLMKAMRANVPELEWMGAETQAEALAKLDKFTTKIGTPEKFKSYEGLDLASNDPLGNAMAAADWYQNFEMERLGDEVDKSEWLIYPQTVNAYYLYTGNEIVFPAAILQPPFFNIDADPAVNYGAIGGVIGHEIGHGFDDQGSKGDGDGNLRNWWSEEDKANFVKLQNVLGGQYDGYCPYDDGAVCHVGALTMGENIGDLGGLSLAYRAYKMSLGGKEAPVIDGYTGDQRFFMAWAQVWRALAREEQERLQLQTGPHSLPQYRVNGIVRNFDEWYKAFNVTPDDELYLPPEQRVRIW